MSNLLPMAQQFRHPMPAGRIDVEFAAYGAANPTFMADGAARRPEATLLL
jgi:hypothetical protein